MNKSPLAFPLRSTAMALSCLLLTACLGGEKPPATQYYLLRADNLQFTGKADKVHKKTLSSVQLGNVTVAPYLHQSGLVLETGNHRIAVARYHQWSEPLTSSIPRFLSRSISDAYGAEIITAANAETVPTTKIDVQIDQLHGLRNGDVRLQASWTLSTLQAASDKDMPTQRSYAFNDAIALNSDGYDALVATEQQLLSNLAQAIARSLP